MANNRDTNSIIAAKRQLVADLKTMLVSKFEVGNSIDQRAMELFRFSSAILGIAAGLGISANDIHGNLYLTLGFVTLLIVYIIHVYCLYWTLRPQEYSIVPGIPRLATTYEDFYKSYIGDGEDGYLEQMISDLGGTDDMAGAIEDAEALNGKKAEFFQWLGLSFVALIAILLVMGTIAIGTARP